MFQQLISVGKMHYKQQILFCLQQILNLLFFVKNSQNLITNNPIKQSNPRNSKHSRCQKRDCIQTYAPFLFTYYLFTLTLFINYFILYHHPLLHRILNRTSSVLLFAAPQKKTDNELFFNLFIANF